jgi:hypothetical protein
VTDPYGLILGFLDLLYKIRRPDFFKGGIWKLNGQPLVVNPSGHPSKYWPHVISLNVDRTKADVVQQWAYRQTLQLAIKLIVLFIVPWYPCDICGMWFRVLYLVPESYNSKRKVFRHISSDGYDWCADQVHIRSMWGLQWIRQRTFWFRKSRGMPSMAERLIASRACSSM